MSYYLELLEKRNLKLSKEQIATRRALSYAHKNKTTRPLVSQLRREAEEAIEQDMKKGNI